jgi:hypothetical protein
MQTRPQRPDPYELQRRSQAVLNGIELEDRVARILKRLGKWNIRRNIIMRDRYGNTRYLPACMLKPPSLARAKISID